MAERSCNHCDEPILDPPPAPSCPVQCGSIRCRGYRKTLVDIRVKPIVWLLGGPGCGKGTQSALMVERYGFVHISIGKLLREETTKSITSKNLLMKEIMRAGALIPNEVVLAILKEKIMSTLEGAPGYVVDGFPVESQQGLEFIKHISPPSVIIYIETSDETLLSRLKYHAQHGADKRLDDDEEVFHSRIQTFHAYLQDILQQNSQLIRKVNGEKTPNEIFTEIARILDPIVTESEIEQERRRICKKSGCSGRDKLEEN